MMPNTVERFSDRVANYIKYRPDYPPQVVEYLAAEHGLKPGDTVADVGCGPGTSCRQFLENGNNVIGVEPNAAMRAAAAELLAGFPNFKLVDGTSEATTLADASVDLVTAAQAFHWFDPEPTDAEFHRILKPGGRIALMWNERCLDTDVFHIEYEALLLKYGRDYEKVRHENVGRDKLGAFFRGGFSTATFPNFQLFDFDGLKGRLLSSSYMPNESDPVYPAMIDELQSLFAKHSENGRITVLYDTNVYTSQG